MQHSEQIDKIAGALAKAQAMFINPPRNKTVTVRTQGSGTYEFSYATFDAILDAVRKPLAENELSIVQAVDASGDKPRVVTTLLHSSGQWISSSLPLLLDRPGNQAFGSALTYQKRYGLTALLAIAADEDDDANGADGNSIERRTERQPTPPQVKTAPPPNVPAPPVTAAARWTDEAIRALKAMTTGQQVAEWQSGNRSRLDRLSKTADADYTRLMDIINERLDAFRPRQRSNP